MTFLHALPLCCMHLESVRPMTYVIYCNCSRAIRVFQTIQFSLCYFNYFVGCCFNWEINAFESFQHGSVHKKTITNYVQN